MADIIQLLDGKADAYFASELLSEASDSGSEISASDLAAVRKWTRSEIDPARVFTFPALAIDTKPTRNNVQYSADSQKQSVKDWVGIPFLFNGNGSNPAGGNADHTLQAASQVGRIYKSAMAKTPAGETGTVVWVYSVKGVDAHTDAFINRVEAGILREVSIHVQLDNIESALCSICNKPFSDCDKGHVPGQKYGRQTCSIVTSGHLTPLELSSVACPGSPNAHIMSDEETAKILSLRESFGGTEQAIATIARLSEKTMITDDNKTEAAIDAELEEKKKTAPDLTPADDKGNQGKELCESCMHAAHPGAKCAAEACECDESAKVVPATDLPESAPVVPPVVEENAQLSFHIFTEGVCAACGLDTQREAAVSEETRTLDGEIAKLRSEMQESVKAIVTAANAKVKEALDKVSVAESAASENADAKTHLAELLTALRIESVDLAVSKGIKSEAQRGAYAEELSVLTYPALKVALEALRAADKANPREEQRAKLQAESAQAAKALTERRKISIAPAPAKGKRNFATTSR